MTKYIQIDTEFNNSNEAIMNIICIVCIDDVSTNRFSLLENKDLDKLKIYLDNNKDAVFLAYAAAAEARSLISLGIDPKQFRWLDLYVEFRMLCNSNNLYNYGNYLDDDGNVAYSIPPKIDEEDEDNHKDVPKNLVNALYKVCNIKIDVDQKHEMRNLILSKDVKAIELAIDEIMDYCESDTKYLTQLHKGIQAAYTKLGLVGFEEAQLERGRFSICMAEVENRGLPINMSLLNKIIDKTPEILNEKKKEVDIILPNYFVPEIQREPKILKNGKKFHYKIQEARTNTNTLQEFIKNLKLSSFPLTDSGKFKTDKKTLQDYSYIPEFKALLSHNNLSNNLKWFAKDNSKGFFGNLGSDNNIRPYYGIFGTQTGRNAAKATTFPLAMGSWLRCIIQPPKGKVIIGSDFSQQEVYVAAVLSGDRNLMEAYKSGDVYLYFGKLTGVIPQNGTKDSHKDERNQFKATTLGKQFGMGIDKLHESLKASSKNPSLPRSRAEEMDRYHKETFEAFWQHTYETSNRYKSGIPLITSDGWVLWQDNQVMTSVRNFMVQGTAAAITRKAVILLVQAGIKVIAPLHDAIYAICDEDKAKEVTGIIEEAMRMATEIVLKEEKTFMRIDTKIVTHDKIWTEEKSQKDLERLAPILNIKVS